MVKVGQEKVVAREVISKHMQKLEAHGGNEHMIGGWSSFTVHRIHQL